ncbi:anti-sigma factor domain-containing protein [Saccharibacillus sp. JS10]|uniref:anti-sigma factor n=1 Tax=Saccharibacillus sp. JS10 TaxID=2950552 RepID=UPI00210C860D|nr:anti-sigma factor [Saccharibacillus sp. JS10]MCQ4086693.1 anti-sigma factor [Saccharibacillus sp. JS10]
MSERKDSMIDLAEEYALGGMDELEQAEYEFFLSEHAEEQQRVTELLDTTGMLALASKPVTPPSGMKNRILANVLGNSETEMMREQALQSIEADSARRDVEERSHLEETAPSPVRAVNDRVNSEKSTSTATPVVSTAKARLSRSLWAGAATIMAAAAVILAIYTGQLRSEMNDMRSTLTAMEQRTSDMQQQLTAANSPAVGAQVDRTVALVGSEEDPSASGMAAMVQDDTGTRLVVQASDLPKLSGNEAYQVWLIKGDQKINAGTFLSGDGKGALTYTMEPGDYDMVAITLEPDAEGDQPRGRIVLAGALA